MRTGPTAKRVEDLSRMYRTGGMRALDIECSRILDRPIVAPREAAPCSSCVQRRWRWADIVTVTHGDIDDGEFHWFAGTAGRLCMAAAA